MLTRIALTTLVAFPLIGIARASDRLVPPPPVPNVTVTPPSAPVAPSTQVVPASPQPATAPAGAIHPIPETNVPATTVAPAVTPAVTSPATAIQYGSPAFQYPSNPIMLQDGSVSQYLYQPSIGTYPPSQSQYNAFSTTGMPPAPMSFSPNVGMHDRYPYYSYRRPWYTPGMPSRNVNIIW